MVSPDELEVEDIAVSITRPVTEPDLTGNRCIERTWLSPRHYEDALGIADVDEELAGTADAVIVLAELELPGDLQGTPTHEIKVDVELAETPNINFNLCPGCSASLKDTLEDWECGNCGMVFE